MNWRLFVVGLLIWAGATVLLRLLGERFFSPDHTILTAAIFLVSFPLMALFARGLCRRFRVPMVSWPSAAVSLALPTLLLDAFSSSFLPWCFRTSLLKWPACSAVGCFGAAPEY
jgi:hypothetical protein